VPLPADPDPALQSYAHPERLVTADWLSANLGRPGLVIVESDEDVLLYDTGHIPGAVKIDWHTDLNDPHVRDYINGAQFAELMDRKGVSRDDTVVIYGDKSNWWAAYALWVFTLFGHPDVRLLDGGRDLWISDGRDTTLDVPSKQTTGYPVVERDDAPIRAFKDEVLAILGRQPLIDVRSPQEFTGERTHMPDYPEEGALRGGHIPTARSIPWGKAARDNGRFRSRAELDELYGFVQPDDKTIVYCRIGERSSHTWFVLTHLLGKPGVRNYDGSWTEWGNAVRVPVAVGPEPGGAPGSSCVPSPQRWPRWCRTSRTFTGRTSCSCCWSSPTTCRPCLPILKRRRWSRCPNASRRCFFTSTPPTVTGCGCTSAHPPRPRRHAVSPPSLLPASTSNPPRTSWRCLTISTPIWASRR